MNSAIGYSEGAEVPEDKTITDNELIAQFMGFVQSKSSLGNTWEHPERMGIYGGVGLKLKYSTSWDWLMPVVEKINGMGYDALILCNGIHTEKHSCDITTTGDVYAATTGKSLIETVYKAVVEFIKWYNLESLKNKPI